MSIGDKSRADKLRQKRIERKNKRKALLAQVEFNGMISHQLNANASGLMLEHQSFI